MDDGALSEAYAAVHHGGAQGLARREVGLLIAHLRANAVDDSPDAEWLQPTKGEVKSAMRAMDANNDDDVSLDEFKEWYVAKGGQEYAEDPGVWGDDGMDGGDSSSDLDGMSSTMGDSDGSGDEYDVAPEQHTSPRAASAPEPAPEPSSSSRRVRAPSPPQLEEPEPEPEQQRAPEIQTRRTPTPAASSSEGEPVRSPHATGADEAKALAQTDTSLAIDLGKAPLWTAIALWDNDSSHDSTEDDLHFRKGDIIDVVAEDIEEVGPEWAVGQIAGTTDAGHHGFFPLTYVRRLTDGELAQLRPPQPEPEPEPEQEPELEPEPEQVPEPPREAWQVAAEGAAEEGDMAAAETAAAAKEAAAAAETARAEIEREREARIQAEQDAEEARGAAEAIHAAATAKIQAEKQSAAVEMAAMKEKLAAAQSQVAQLQESSAAAESSQRTVDLDLPDPGSGRALAEAEAQPVVALAMGQADEVAQTGVSEKDWLTENQMEAIESLRTEMATQIEAEKAARVAAEQEAISLRKLAEEQAARFADQATRMTAARSSSADEESMGEGMAEEYSALLEQVASEEAMREAAEKQAVHAQTELVAAQEAVKVVEKRLRSRSRVAEKEVAAVQEKLDAEKASVLELKEEIAVAEADIEAQARFVASEAGAGAEGHSGSAGGGDASDSLAAELAVAELEEEKTARAELKEELQEEKTARAAAEQAAEEARENADQQAERFAAKAEEMSTAAEEAKNEEMNKVMAEVASLVGGSKELEEEIRKQQSELVAAHEAARVAQDEAAAEKRGRLAAEAVSVRSLAGERYAMAEMNEQAAATSIQSRQRGKTARKELKEQRHAATKIQAVHRGKASRKKPVDLAAGGERRPKTSLAGRTEEEVKLAAFTNALAAPEPEPEPEREQPLSDSDTERNAVWLATAGEEAKVLSEVMSELLAENPELSQEQIQEAVKASKGNRKIVPNMKFQEYVKEKLSTKNLDDELKEVAVSLRGKESRPRSVRGRAKRGGSPKGGVAPSQSAAVKAVNRSAQQDTSTSNLPASSQRRMAKMQEQEAEAAENGSPFGQGRPTPKIALPKGKAAGDRGGGRRSKKDPAFSMMGSPRDPESPSGSPGPRPRPPSKKRAAGHGRKGVKQNLLASAAEDRADTAAAAAAVEQPKQPKPPKKQKPTNGSGSSSARGGRKVRSARRSEARIGAGPIRPAASGRIMDPPPSDGNGGRDWSDGTLVDEAQRLMAEVAALAGDSGDSTHEIKPSQRATDVLGALSPAMVDGLAEVMRTDDLQLRRRAAAVAGVLLEGDLGALTQALSDAVEAKKVERWNNVGVGARGSGSDQGAEELRALWDNEAAAEHEAGTALRGGSPVRGGGRKAGRTGGYNRPASAGDTLEREAAAAAPTSSDPDSGGYTSGRVGTNGTGTGGSSANGRWAVGRRTPPHLRKDKDDNPGMVRPAYPDKLSRISSGVAAPCFADLTPLARERRQKHARVQALRASGADARPVIWEVRQYSRTQRKADKRLSRPLMDHSDGSQWRPQSSRAHNDLVTAGVKTKDRGRAPSGSPDKARPVSAPKERETATASEAQKAMNVARRNPKHPRPKSAVSGRGKSSRPATASPKRGKSAGASPEKTVGGKGSMQDWALERELEQTNRQLREQRAAEEHEAARGHHGEGSVALQVVTNAVTSARVGIEVAMPYGPPLHTAPLPLWQQQQLAAGGGKQTVRHRPRSANSPRGRSSGSNSGPPKKTKAGGVENWGSTSASVGVMYAGTQPAHPSGRESVIERPTVGATVLVTRPGTAGSSRGQTTGGDYGRRTPHGSKRAPQPQKGARGAGRSVAVGVAVPKILPNRPNDTPRTSDPVINDMLSQVKQMEVSAGATVEVPWPLGGRMHDWQGGGCG